MEPVAKPILIHKTIRSIEFIYRSMGVNVGIKKRTRMEKVKSRIIFITNFLWLGRDLAGAIAWFFMGLIHDKSFTELTYVSPCITFSFLGKTKALSFNMNEDDIDELIDKLKEFEIKEMESARNDEKDEIIMSEHNFIWRLLRLLNIMYFVLIIAFALCPLCLTYLNYRTTNVFHLELPFLILYPFDASDIRYWPYVYLHQIWSEVIVVGYNCGGDYLFYIFCSYIRTQFRLLKYYIENIIPSEISREDLNKEEIKSKLIALVKVHQNLISCAARCEKLFTKSMLQNFVSSSILICLTGFNVMVISDIVIVITFLSFLFMSLLQIFFLCFFGDLMMASSMEVGDAAYNSRWYKADPSISKYMLTMQIRSKIACKLTAYNFYEVNLNAFMKVLSTAWSYLALLQTLYGAPAE